MYRINCSKSDFSRKLSDDNRINCCIQLLDQTSRNQWKYKSNNAFPIFFRDQTIFFSLFTALLEQMAGNTVSIFHFHKFLDKH